MAGVPGELLALAAALGIVACGGDEANGDDCAGAFGRGDLVITEVMANPTDGVEYVEIFNPGLSPADLIGLVIFAGDSFHEIGPVIIEPGGYFVVGSVDDVDRPPHVDYGYGAGLPLAADGGDLGLRCRGVLIDEIEYAAATAGVAVELDGSAPPDAGRNDQQALYCASTHEFAPGSFGTPRESNRFCRVFPPATCSDSGGERSVAYPAVGDVVITELMPDPEAVEDVDGQWFELLALADFDLNGLHAGTEVDSPRSQIDSPACIPVTAGQHILVARDLDEAVNGGLPAVDATFSFRLASADGALLIGVGDTTLDEVGWAASAPATSISLGVRNSDPVANDAAAAFCPGTVAYNAADLGSPGAANDFCVLASECLDTVTMMPRERVVPGAGEIAIVEWMANPEAAAGNDNTGEYIEVRFDVAADANGMQLGSDVGVVRSTVQSRDCLPMTANQVVVFVRDLDPAQNGGIDVAIGVTGFGMLNAGDRIFAGYGNVELDVIADTGNANANAGPGDEGVSAQIDGVGQLCDTPAGSTYGDGDRGTPGVANPSC